MTFEYAPNMMIVKVHPHSDSLDTTLLLIYPFQIEAPLLKIHHPHRQRQILIHQVFVEIPNQLNKKQILVPIWEILRPPIQQPTNPLAF